MENALLDPERKIPVDGTRSSELAFRQGLPLDSRPEDVEDSGEDLPKVQRRTPAAGSPFVRLLRIAFFPDQQRLRERPELVGKFPDGNRCLFSFFHTKKKGNN